MASTKTPLEVGVLFAGRAVQLSDIMAIDTFSMMSPQYVGELASLGPALQAIQPLAVPMNISYISETGEAFFALTANAKIGITHSVANAPKLDIIIIPGPPPSEEPSEAITSFIASSVARGATVLSVCTGIIALAASGALDGRVATGPLGVMKMLRAKHPAVQWQDARRWEKSVGSDGKGDVWTCGGMANGLDLICAFMRDRFPESRALADMMIGFEDIPQRPAEYPEEQKEMYKSVTWV